MSSVWKAAEALADSFCVRSRWKLSRLSSILPSGSSSSSSSDSCIDRSMAPTIRVPIFDGEGDRGNQDPILSAFFQILFLLIDRPSKLHRAVQRTALWRQIWVYIQELLSDQLLRFIQIGQLFIEFRGKQDLSIQIQDRDAINITLLKN